MRGKHFCGAAHCQTPRITPADAGKTRQPFVHFPGVQDHPRVCGENARRSSAHRQKAGSPPRMRGKLNGVRRYARFVRITPADAGKTGKTAKVRHRRQDHPRGCGENGGMIAVTIGFVGSPPRMRGKPRAKAYMSAPLRITPADAGKTATEQAYFDLLKDHPRRCGENSVSGSTMRYSTGSPPQVRGKLMRPLKDTEAARITPAGAGKTNLPQTLPTTI